MENPISKIHYWLYSPVLPSLFTLTRLAVIPMIYWLAYIGHPLLIATYFLACLTDLIDGYVARSFRSVSVIGSLFDAITDYLLIMTVLMYFVQIGSYPTWLPPVVVLAFVQYMITFRVGQINDPLGKHIGTLLFLALGISLTLNNILLNLIFSYFVSVYIVVSIALRWKAIALNLKHAGRATY